MTRFLVTGAYGCIGAWVVHELVAAGLPVVTFDLASDARRLRLLLDDDAVDAITHVSGDITDLSAVERSLDEHAITNIVHLAALQVPACRASPPEGARVNVVGTVNVFAAAAKRNLEHVVYASSIAVFDADGSLESPPGTLYGVYKRDNEACAAVFFAESGASSIGLRPHTVYGVGRDQGLTSTPTVAMLAAAAGRPYTIPYGGSAQFQLARDTARAFVAASLLDYDGASVHNLPGHVVEVSRLVDLIGAEGIDHEEALLPFPAEVDSSSFEALVPPFTQTPLEEGVQTTVDRFRVLLSEGKALYE